MKKYLVFFFSLITLAISSSSQSVNLDTVRVRNLQLRARDYLWGIGQLTGSKDSSILYWVDRIGRSVKNQVPNINQQNWNTTVTIDSLPGRLVLYFYDRYTNVSGGMQREIGNTIYTGIRAITQLQYFIGASDAAFQKEYIEDVKSGKAAGYDN